eukprot:TRINITY_DN33898_c0_g1_i1.p1 TRINITY_DN33898_c0_g1~~TRINITY_DN33898_c0_g1_i1.p1  ORF type:complete len:585 (-),score=182.07 TRINITY_DN33898_c0_g1_i1:220-1974(-)
MLVDPAEQRRRFEEEQARRAEIFELVGGSWTALRDQEEKYRDDKDIVLQAVQHDGGALQFASERLRGDRDIVYQAVCQSGTALGAASKELRGDARIVLEAVSRDGWALQFASEELRANKDVVLAAVQNRGGALQRASEELRKDKEVVLAAVAQDGWAFEFADESLKGTPPEDMQDLVSMARQWKVPPPKAKSASQMMSKKKYGGPDPTDKEIAAADRDVAKAAVEQRGWGEDYLSEELNTGNLESRAELYQWRRTQKLEAAIIPPPKPLEQHELKTRALHVTIVSARNLKNADSTERGEGVSDPFCTFQIVGKPESKVETEVIQDNLDPIWDHDFSTVWSVGEDLLFEIFDKDLKSCDFLGRAKLSCDEFHPNGFDGELLLSDPDAEGKGVAVVSQMERAYGQDKAKTKKNEPEEGPRKAYLYIVVAPCVAVTRLFEDGSKGAHWVCWWNGYPYVFCDDGSCGSSLKACVDSWKFLNARTCQVDRRSPAETYIIAFPAGDLLKPGTSVEASSAESNDRTVDIVFESLEQARSGEAPGAAPPPPAPPLAEKATQGALAPEASGQAQGQQAPPATTIIPVIAAEQA